MEGEDLLLTILGYPEGTEKDFTFQADFTDFVIDPIQEEVLVLVLDGLRPVLFELLVGFLDDGGNSLRAHRPTGELFGDTLQFVGY